MGLGIGLPVMRLLIPIAGIPIPFVLRVKTGKGRFRKLVLLQNTRIMCTQKILIMECIGMTVGGPT